MDVKYYIGEILEINCNYEYETNYIFNTYEIESLDEHTDRVAMNWRGGNKHDWDVNKGCYRSRHTFIFNNGCKEISKEEFDVLSKHLAIL